MNRKNHNYFDISKNMVENRMISIYLIHMEHEDAVKKLSELGHTTRLAVFRYLVKTGPEGVPVGRIQKAIDIPGSTLSHHISRLVSVGLVTQTRAGTTLYCTAQYTALRKLIDFLESECCIGVDKCK